MNIYTKKRHYNEEKPTPLIYCLQSLQGQCCGTHLRVSILKLLRELVFLSLQEQLPKFWVQSRKYFQNHDKLISQSIS